ncbi:PREDICTED: sugar transporter ERD6-like 18 [Tarenaya hassleriana]|uniref:sugar transporter ERD6-like 18 n=1 Tax=Tarenaya hassleriana TaxID=28532 RepID=UPI00053C9830|nr:PREDICTED: sugar transporter ERD6-like 18 [Tarenaya hassleriana]
MVMVVEEERSMEAGLLQRRDQNDSEECRITACVILSTFVAVCSSFTFGCATGYSSGSEEGIMEELGLSVAQFSAFGAFSTLGAAVGALFSGKMAIILGRRGTMWVSDLFCIMGWLSIAFAKDVLWLDFGRISSGIGVGLISYVVPVYIAEITPKHMRGAFVFSNQLLQNCGIAMIYFFGNFINWRTLAIIGAIPCLVQAVGLFYIPESPRWLAKIGTDKEVESCLHRLRGRDVDVSREATEIRAITEILEQDSKSDFSDLFQKKYRRTLMVGIGLMLIQQFSGSAGVIFYASTIFRKAGFSVTIGSTILGLFMIPKAMIGLILVDSWGRRPLLLASGAGMCISSMLLGASFALQKFQLLPELTPLFTFLCVLVYIATFAVGVGGLPWIIMSEIFPINIKVTAGSIVTLTSWISSWLVTYTFNFMFEWSTQGTFYIFSVICGASFVFIWRLVPETKGLTLEEIQASLTTAPSSSLE